MNDSETHLELPSIRELQSGLRIKSNSALLVQSRRSVSLIAMFVLGMFVLAIAALMFAPWVQTVEGVGRVMAYSPNDRQQDLGAPVDGRIGKWHVQEGQSVRVGDPIVDIEDMDPDIMERLSRERDATEAKMQAAQQSVESSKRNVERQRLLWSKGLSARRSYELAELEYAKFLGDVSSTAAELARLETRIARQASQSMTATTNGIVQQIYAPQGGVVVKQGERLAVIVPESSDRAVELLVSGNDIPLISVGREVRLQFEGWPAVQFSGWPSVAVGTFGGTVGVVDQSDDGFGRFRVIVFPNQREEWPAPIYLRQGVRVVGWVQLDTVRLGWELWRRMNAFPLSVPLKPSSESSIQGATSQEARGQGGRGQSGRGTL